jgi:hypothetical protein
MTKKLHLIAALALMTAFTAGADVTPEAVKALGHRCTQPQPTLRVAQNTKANAVYASDGDDDDVIITSVTGGTPQQYSRSAHSIYYTTNGYKTEDVTGNITEVVFTDDGMVYIKNPNSKWDWSSNCYMVGTVANDTVSIKLPQYVALVGKTQVYLSMMAIGEDYATDHQKIEDQTLRFTLKDGVLTQIGDAYLSFTDKSGHDWYGYADTNIELHPYKSDALTDVNLPGEDYIFTYDGNNGHYVTVAKDGQDVYIKNLFKSAEGVWIKGTLNGTKATFDLQPLGLINGSEAYFFPAKQVTVNTEYEYNGVTYPYSYVEYHRLASLELNYDAQKDAYVADDDVVILAATSQDDEVLRNPLTVYATPRIKRQGDVSEAIPAAPSLVGFYNYYTWMGEYDFDFYLNLLSTQGDLLDESKLYYNILLDDEPMTFDAGDYGLDEDIEDMPYSMSSGSSIIPFGVERVIAIFSDGFESVGVQILYRPEEGKEFRSDILYYDLATKEATVMPVNDNSGVSSLSVDRQVKNVTYYDLTGRRVTNPSNGIYVKRTAFNDGSVTTAKQVIK